MNPFALIALSWLLLASCLLVGCTSLDQVALTEESLAREAENFVAVFNAAVATESEELVGVGSPIEAVQLLRRGVSGGTHWAHEKFIVPSVALEDVEPIARRLEIITVRDAEGAKIPMLQRRSGS